MGSATAKTGPRPAEAFAGTEHRTQSGGRDLFLWQKRARGTPRGRIVFVHGSSMASQPTFDLQVEGMPEASAMNWFAARGFDAWCFDCRGYGRSYKADDVWATIAEGAEDTDAAVDFVMRDGQGPVLLYGMSSGALRAGMFAERHPEKVRRLALDALVWTGEGSVTLQARRQRLDEWRASTRRPLGRDFLMSVLTRDQADTTMQTFVEPFVEQVLALDDSMPNGTYVDMCSKLPAIDPERITVPTLVMRGEFDGIATLDDLLGFFARLPNPDRQFTVMPGIAHTSFNQKNHLLAFEVLCGFFARG